MKVFINDKEFEIVVAALFHLWRDSNPREKEQLRIVIERIELCHRLQGKKKAAPHKGNG